MTQGEAALFRRVLDFGLFGVTLRWSGVISDTPIVTLTYAVTVTTGSTQVITNTALIAGGAIDRLERCAMIITNGHVVFLPLIRK